MSFAEPETSARNQDSAHAAGACCSGSVWVWLALLVSAAALAGSLYLSLGMGLKACPLCFYQRTFAMSLLAVLAVGVLFGVGPRLGTLALPLAAAGLGVAIFHVYLEASGKLECPAGVLGLGTAPQQSLALFALLFVLLVIDVLKRGAAGIAALLVALVLGGGLALASSTSNPPMPPAPEKAYAAPPEVCRPPFRGP
jgi:disulfide bond formation protein DsbB